MPETKAMERFYTQNGLFLILAGPGELDKTAVDKLAQAAGTGADCVYGDETLRRPDGRQERVYKPDYSPDTLLSYNYIGSPLAVSEALFVGAGGREPEDEAERYAFTLNVCGAAHRVAHVPEALFTGPPVQRPKDAAQVVAAALKRLDRPGTANRGMYPGSVQVRYGTPPKARLSVIVTGGSADLIHETLSSLETVNTLPNVELVVCPGGQRELRMEWYCTALMKNKAAAVVDGGMLPEPARWNLAAATANGDALLFLEQGVRIRAHDGLERLMGHALRHGIGCAGGKVTAPDGKLIHTGLALCAPGEPRSLFEGRRDGRDDPLKNDWTNCIRNVSAVGYALMIERGVFHAARGFDETLTTRGAEAELGLKLMKAGRWNVYDPYAEFLLTPRPQAQPDERQTLRLTDILRACRREGDPYITRSPGIFPGGG